MKYVGYLAPSNFAQRSFVHSCHIVFLKQDFSAYGANRRRRKKARQTHGGHGFTRTAFADNCYRFILADAKINSFDGLRLAAPRAKFYPQILYV